MKKVALASAVLAAMSAVPAFAQVDGSGPGPDLSSANAGITNRFYISPMGSHVWEDSKRQTDDGWGGGVAIGKQFSTFFSAEVSAFMQEHHVGHGADSLEMLSVGVSGLVFPFSGAVSRNIYAIIGAHYGDAKKHPAPTALDQNEDKDYDTVLGSAGLGFLYGPFAILNQGSIRIETLYRMDFHDKPELGGADADDFGDVITNLGVLIPIGGQTTPPPPPEPEPVEVVPAAAPVDSDGDGVTDDLDQCPGTPAGEPVNEVGCPLPKKECKTPEPGQPVTLEGCAAGDKIVLRGVNFEFDKSRLTSNAKTILDDVTDALNKVPDVTIELGGHTDARGSDEYNQKLSERRAASVRQYLVGRGIEAGRMTSAGYGESQPVADNETDEGRELNRRVELKITGGNTTIAPAAEEAPAASEAPAADAPAAEPTP